jgi:hypothetical protein
MELPTVTETTPPSSVAPDTTQQQQQQPTPQEHPSTDLSQAPSNANPISDQRTFIKIVLPGRCQNKRVRCGRSTTVGEVLRLVRLKAPNKDHELFRAKPNSFAFERLDTNHVVWSDVYPPVLYYLPPEVRTAILLL